MRYAFSEVNKENAKCILSLTKLESLVYVSRQLRGKSGAIPQTGEASGAGTKSLSVPPENTGRG